MKTAGVFCRPFFFHQGASIDDSRQGVPRTPVPVSTDL